MGAEGRAKKKGGGFLLRATQHSAAVQIAAMHVFVAGLVIRTFDVAAHPAKPIHVAAENWGERLETKGKKSPRGTAKSRNQCFQWRHRKRKANKIQAQCKSFTQKSKGHKTRHANKYAMLSFFYFNSL